MREDSLYTLGGKLLDFSGIDWSNPDINYYYKWGWEYVTYKSNLYQKELNSYGPGVEKNDIFVDIGANIGMSSICAEICGASKIYSVEPDPECFKSLNMNKGYNWKTFNHAISSYNGYIDIDIWPQNVHKTKVPCVPLDDFVQSLDVDYIDYMKVDIEGWEESVFNVTKKSTFDRIRKFFIEYHGGDNDSINKFVDIFKRNDFINSRVVFGGPQSFIYIWK